LAKGAWVTLWFPATNLNKMMSPTLAATVEGVKVLPPCPTVTVMFSAKTEGSAAVAKRARAEANFIFAN